MARLFGVLFDGVVRGAQEINGYRPSTWDDFNQTGYFSRKDGLAHLAEIKLFWDGVDDLLRTTDPEANMEPVYCDGRR